MYLVWATSDQPAGPVTYLATVTDRCFASTALAECIRTQTPAFTDAQVDRLCQRLHLRQMAPSRDCRGQAFLEVLYLGPRQ